MIDVRIIDVRIFDVRIIDVLLYFAPDAGNHNSGTQGNYETLKNAIVYLVSLYFAK